MQDLSKNEALLMVKQGMELKARRSAAAKKGAETKREKARIEALKPKVRNLFSPAPVYKARPVAR
jgi:hypothetical protein